MLATVGARRSAPATAGPRAAEPEPPAREAYEAAARVAPAVSPSPPPPRPPAERMDDFGPLQMLVTQSHAHKTLGQPYSPAVRGPTTDPESCSLILAPAATPAPNPAELRGPKSTSASSPMLRGPSVGGGEGEGCRFKACHLLLASLSLMMVRAVMGRCVELQSHIQTRAQRAAAILTRQFFLHYKIGCCRHGRQTSCNHRALSSGEGQGPGLNSYGMWAGRLLLGGGIGSGF